MTVAGSARSGHEPLTQPNDPLSEDALKQVLKAWLESEGWKVEVAWGKTPGVDILAEKDGRRWIIEVKGPGSRNAMRVNYFLAILGETLQRMNDPDAMYSIALPDLPQYRGLWDRLPPLAKGRTGISLLLVAEDGTLTVLDHNHRDPIPGAGPQAPKPRKSLAIKLAGSEGDGWPPYKRKRLILAWVTAALLVPWTGLWTLILVPLTIFVAPLAVLTIPLFLLVVGAPGAWAFNAIVEEYMRRAHWRSLAAASGDPTDS